MDKLRIRTMQENMRKLLLISITFFASLLFGIGSVQAKGAKTEISHWRTLHKTEVFFVPSHELPIVDIRLLVDAGSARDGNMPGLAALTANLLDEGTRNLNSDDIAQRFDNSGAQFAQEVSRDFATVTLRSLSDPKFLDPSLNTMIAASLSPSFPNDAFEREKKAAIREVEQNEQSPETVAFEQTLALLYPNHPYGHPSYGTIDSLQKITRTDVQNFYRQYYVSENVQLVIVGDLTQKQAENVAEKISHALIHGEKAAPIIDVAKTNTADATANPHFVAFPTTQTNIVMGQIGLARLDPDYYALVVGNQIVGGGGTMTSRLFEQVREKRGLAYSVDSYFMPMAVAGPYLISMQTRKSEAKNSLAIAKQTLADYVQNGPSIEEVAAAKKYLMGNFPLRFASNGDVLGLLSIIAFYHLPLTYMEDYPKEVARVSKKAIQQAFKRRIDPSNFTIVEVGEKNAPATTEKNTETMFA